LTIFDLFKRLSDVELIPAKRKSRIDARIYCFFESKKSHKIFEIAMWGYGGDDDSIFVKFSPLFILNFHLPPSKFSFSCYTCLIGHIKREGNLWNF
jgi:hypothetical protein